MAKRALTASELCEGQRTVPQTDEHGKALEPLIEACARGAKYVVTRKFSGIEQQLCSAHARRFVKNGTGAYDVRQVSA